MTLSRLHLAQFRSWARLDIDLDHRPVAIHGPNGAGKTNILEAISMLSPGRGMRGAAPWVGSSNRTCTGRSNHSAANASIWWEKFFRTQSSLKRLGAATRSTACVSSYASGTSGRIHALICWGGSSCSRRLTQVCQNSFMSLLFKPRFYLAWAGVIHRARHKCAQGARLTV